MAVVLHIMLLHKAIWYAINWGQVVFAPLRGVVFSPRFNCHDRMETVVRIDTSKK